MNVFPGSIHEEDVQMYLQVQFVGTAMTDDSTYTIYDTMDETLLNVENCHH